MSTPSRTLFPNTPLFRSQLKSQLRNSESHSSCSEELHKLSESKSRSSNNQHNVSEGCVNNNIPEPKINMRNECMLMAKTQSENYDWKSFDTSREMSESRMAKYTQKAEILKSQMAELDKEMDDFPKSIIESEFIQ